MYLVSFCANNRRQPLNRILNGLKNMHDESKSDELKDAVFNTMCLIENYSNKEATNLLYYNIWLFSVNFKNNEVRTSLLGSCLPLPEPFNHYSRSSKAYYLSGVPKTPVSELIV